jgi:ferredoxin-NADP reductase
MDLSRFRSFVSLSEFTKHLEFEVLGETRFDFVPGKWLSFRQRKTDGEEITRAYSLCFPSRRCQSLGTFSQPRAARAV